MQEGQELGKVHSQKEVKLILLEFIADVTTSAIQKTKITQRACFNRPKKKHAMDFQVVHCGTGV